jgi:hypothetical protein
VPSGDSPNIWKSRAAAIVTAPWFTSARIAGVVLMAVGWAWVIIGGGFEKVPVFVGAIFLLGCLVTLVVSAAAFIAGPRDRDPA